MTEKKMISGNPAGTALRLLRFAGKYRSRLVAACLCMVVSSAAAVLGTYYLKPMINDCLVPLIGQSVNGGLIAALSGDAHPLISRAAWMLVKMAACYLISMLASFMEGQLMASLSNHVLFDLRVQLYRCLVRQPLGSVSSRASGELMSGFTSDMDSLGNMLRRSLPYLINGTVTCLSILVTMAAVNIWLTLVTLACTGLILPVVRWLGRGSRKHMAAQQADIAAISGSVREYSQAQELVRTLGMEEAAGQKFSEQNARLFEHASRANLYGSNIFTLTNGISRIGFAVMLLAGVLLASAGMADLGTVGLFAQYYSNFTKPLTDMAKQINNVLTALVGAERIFRIMDTEPEEDEGSVTLVNSAPEDRHEADAADRFAGRLAWQAGNRLIPLEGSLSLENVVFGYSPDQTILDGVSLEIRPREKIAVLGSTGAGKTTLISLMNRLYEIRSGEIRFDGIPMKDIRKESLRRAIAMVSQDTHLFTGTVADNLRFGRPDATNDELWEALRMTGADFFVDHLPRGINTVLGDGQVSLSQGQRQLLTIARAAVSDAPVLILDEATSSVDTVTEHRINQAFDRLMAGRTVLVIAHRLSTVQNADRIVILEHGRIVECGKPQELLRQQGYYYKLMKEDAELV